MVRNERLRFGGHIDIEVRYKILQLDVLKKTLGVKAQGISVEKWSKLPLVEKHTYNYFSTIFYCF
jgi:hypothetical protein